MAKFYDAKDVKAAARGGWPSVLSRFGVDASLLTNRHSCCPGCGGKDRFRFDDRDGEGTWICSGGGDMKSGDGIALLMHVKGWEWKEAITALGEALGLDGEERGGSSRRESGVAARPQAQQAKMNELFDIDALREATAGVPPVTPEWFMERSPLDPRRIVPGEFLNVIFEPGERALVFTNFYSQGDFAWEVGRGGFRLGDQPGVKAVKSALPIDGGKDGVWYLSNPVSLKWENNPRKEGDRSRRSKECVTAWRYLVLECDEEKTWRKRAGAMEDAVKAHQAGSHIDVSWFMARGLVKHWAEDAVAVGSGRWEAKAKELRDEAGELPGMWLRFLAKFPEAIRAIYSSGGASWHALVCMPCDTWADMDGLLKGNPRARTAGGKMGAKRLWSIYGADPGALSPVRLTRLPGCTRSGREQKLIYLNPSKDALIDFGGKLMRKPIVDLVPRRKVGSAS